jgi:ATP-binding cassette subfamily B protein
MLKLRAYVKPYLGMVLLALALLVLQVQCDLALPEMMSDIVNLGVLGHDSAYILSAGGRMLLFSLLGAVCMVGVGYLAARVSSGFSFDLRGAVFSKVEYLSGADFDKIPVSSLITRATNDVTQLAMLLLMSIRMVFFAPILGVGGVIKALQHSRGMSWIIGVALLCVVGVVAVLMAAALPRFRAIQKLTDKINLVARENLEGMPVVRAFGTQGFELGRFDAANRELTATNLAINRAMSVMMPSMMLIMNLTTVLIVWVGARQAAAGLTNVGDIMAYMQYAMQIIMSFLMIAMMFIIFPRAAVSAERISEVLALPESVPDPASPQSFGPDTLGDKTGIAFDHVSFRFPGSEEDVLHDITFEARPGTTTAIIGATGSGKTTLVNLIMRFYDVSAGRVLVGGKDVRSVAKSSLRERIGYVPQKAVLFSGTVESNLKYGDKNADIAAIKKAAGIAQATGFIEEKGNGYAEPVAQGGGNVSGGQKQRLSIARALVKNAPILIFDDSFSALDLKTDRLLRSALNRSLSGVTVIIVAQRVSTIMEADNILVLENGAAVGFGPHKKLLEACPVYREIAASQLSEGELGL